MELKQWEHMISNCSYNGYNWTLEIKSAAFKRYFNNKPPYQKGDIVNYQMFLNYIDKLK